MQKWVMEGSYWELNDPRFWGMSQENYNEKRVVALEYLLLNYENDPYVADNIKNEISNIKGNPKTNALMTTQIDYAHYQYFTEELIRAFHTQDAVLFGIGGLLGKETSYISGFGQIYNEMEQNETLPLEAIIKSVGFEMLSKDYPALSKALAVLDVGISVALEDRKSYLLNGFRVYEDDIYLNVVLKTNLGNEIRSTEFIFRDESLVHIADTGDLYAIGPGEARFKSWQNGINKKWLEAGYVGR